MSKNFWKKLHKPILALAPMYDVTDTAFRQIIAKCGKPSIFFTEFISVDGLTNPKSQDKLIKYLLQFNKIERPLIAQIWGNNPKKFCEAAQIIKKLGLDGIDINMGCPDKAVVKSGSGSALILNPQLAQEIIKATKKAAGNLPVSVKTRIGFDKKITEEWITNLLEAKPAAITIHGRTKKEMSKVPADWNEIGKAANLAKGTGVLILGNGDVKNLKDALQKIAEYDLDGVMIGRAALSNPWIFNPKKDISKITPKQKLNLLAKHAELFEKYFSYDFNLCHPERSEGSRHNHTLQDSSQAQNDKLKNTKKYLRNFDMLKKHIKNYTSGFPNAKELRINLMSAKTVKELKNIINH